MDLLANKVSGSEYEDVLSKIPLLYNNLCGHDHIDHEFMKQTINGMDNEIDKHIFETHLYLNLSKRYMFTDESIVDGVTHALIKAEHACIDYSKTNSEKAAAGTDYSDIFRKPILYPLSYIHVNNRPFLEQLSRIYRIQNPNLNYISDRCRQNRIIPRKRIKVGFLSVTFMSMLSSVFRDRSNIIKFMSPTKFEKVLIVQKKIDATIKNKQVINVIEGVHKMVDRVVELPNILENPEEFMKTVADLELDILVYCDIGMASESVILAHARLAPVQINTWGHSVTSGINTIDYYVSSKLYELDDLEEAQTHYTEKLIAMDSMCTSYFKIMFNASGFKTRLELGLPEDKHILFCLQNSFKVNIPFITAMYKNLYLKRPQKDYVVLLLDINLTKDHHEFLKEKYGDDFYSTLRFIPRCQTEEFHNYMYLSDICLDTYPFGGCNTSLEAFMYGKIVITRPSKYLAGRFTHGFYRKMKIADPVVDTYQEYYNKLNLYLDNAEAKKQLEDTIISKRDCLYNDQDSIMEWENLLVKLADPFIRNKPDSYKIDQSYKVNPLDLLSPQRFDILFKYIYVKYRSQWALDYYREHIRVLNGGYEMVTEVQETEKNSVDEFSSTFKSLINDIESSKINDNIPVVTINDDQLYPLNGSHRIGIVLGLGRLNVPVVIKGKTNKMPFGYPSYAFKNRNNFSMPTPGKDVQVRLSQEMIDYAALEYVKLKKGNIRIMTIFSKSDKTQEVVNKLNEFQVSIVSYSEFTLTSNGCYNLIKEMYLDESFVDVKWKTNACFPGEDGGRIGILVIEGEPDNLIHLSQSGGKYKTEIRNIYGNHHAIHVTDNNNDTERVANTLLHKNSWNFLNSQRKQYSNKMDSMFERYRSVADDNSCIVSSYVMGLYSLREPDDLDWITNTVSKAPTGSHNKYKQLYPYQLDEIINNPDNYFYYHGLKCCKLDIVRNMKVNRGETPKDIDDIALIDKILGRSRPSLAPAPSPTSLSSLKELSILRKAINGECRLVNAPFPYICIDNALPQHLYDKLENEYPRIEYFDGPPPFASNSPLFKNCSQLISDDRVSPLWKKFLEYHTSMEFMNEFKKIFQYQLVMNYPHVLTSIAEDFCYRRDKDNNGSAKDKQDFVLDNQLRVNTPVLTSTPSSVIGPHCDNPYKLFVGLMYFPVKDDNAGGDLILYQMKDKTINVKDVEKGRFVPETMLDAKVIIPYKPNTVVLFLNTDKSLHGVASRKQTLAYIRLSTFSASYGEPLFEMTSTKED